MFSRKLNRESINNENKVAANREGHSVFFLCNKSFVPQGIQMKCKTDVVMLFCVRKPDLYKCIRSSCTDKYS